VGPFYITKLSQSNYNINLQMPVSYYRQIKLLTYTTESVCVLIATQLLRIKPYGHMDNVK